MTDLARLKKERNEIVVEALGLVPQRHRNQSMQESLTHLAQCFVIEQDEAHLKDIQSLIDAARVDNFAALASMKNLLAQEIQELRAETQQGFQKVGERMGQLSQRVEHLEKRPHPQQVNVHVTTDRISLPNEMKILAALLTLASLLLLQVQFTNVPRLIPQQQEAK